MRMQVSLAARRTEDENVDQIGGSDHEDGNRHVACTNIKR